MQLLVNSRFPLSRQSEDDYIVPMLVDIRSGRKFDLEEFYVNMDPSNHSEFPDNAMRGGPEFLVGRVWMERLLLEEAEDAGYSMVMICDAAGADWLEVMETLTRKGGQRFRRDLQLDSFVDDIVLLHEIILHPDLTDRVPLIDAAIRATSGTCSLIVAPYQTESERPLRDRDYRELGFRKIASSDLLLRDNRLRYPFGDKHPSGRDVQFTASAEHEAWMLDKWQSLNIDFEV
jgi:hypothetical protein